MKSAPIGDSRKNERGAYIVLFAIALPLLIGMLGLAVDFSHLWYVRGQLQNAADAAAFAGAKEINATTAGRAAATDVALTYAGEHYANGADITAADVVENTTGVWQSSGQSFTTAGATEASANAIRVTVQRADVPLFFARALAGAKASQTVVASAVAVAGGAGQIGCGAPVALAACVLEHDSAGKLICPANLSFQNGPKSVGLTHPDGTSPVNGSNTASYFREALSDPPGCGQEVETSDILYLQNGDDLARRSVDDINAATNDGESPVRVTVPVVDIPCGTGGPNYNRSAPVVGFVYMDIVGARWTDAAPPKVAAACPTLGMKNICVTGDCGLMQGVPGGGTINPEEVQVFLVH